MKLSENISSRRSVRKYKEGGVVTDEQLRLLLEAAMSAPSACNTRPWEFVVVKSREKLEQIAAVHPFAKMLRTASLAIIVCGLPDAQDGIATGFFPQDCAAATQNLLLQSAEMGLGSCWCGVYPREDRLEELRGVLDIAGSAVPFNIIAVGVPEESPQKRGFYDENKVKVIE